MDHMLYLSMNGAEHLLRAQQNNNHNLANVNTHGFKADLEAFRQLPVYGPGNPTRAYSEDLRYGYDFSAGALQQTGRDLDVAVSGEGWIAVLADDGTEAYTRRGDLRIDANGLLSNGAGQLVLGSGGPIAVPPAETLLIGRDGTISIRPLGQSAATPAVVERIRLVAPALAQLEKGSDGLFRLRDGGEAVPDASVSLTSGALETSNVNAVDALVRMLEYARAFEAQIKLMEVAEQTDESSASLLRIS